MNRLLALALLLGACGSHELGLSLTIAADCPVSVPAGGSLLYEIVVDGSEGQAPRVCGACLAIDAAVSDPANLVSLLRASAPSCVISPGASLHVRVTSFQQGGCTVAGAGPTASRLCGSSATVTAESGHGDQAAMVPISCAAGCDSTSCVPISCAAQGKDCDSIADGCGSTIACGSCHPPLKCGGGGTPNVCGK